MRSAICALAACVFLPAWLEAQVCGEGVPPLTRLEAFMGQQGAPMVHGSSRAGAVRGDGASFVAVAIREITNASSGERALGVTIDVKKAEADRRSYVDLEELPALLSGLEGIAKVDRSFTTLDQLETYYRTKGGLVITVYNTHTGMKAAVSTGVTAVVTTELEFAEFLRLRQLLQGAYDSLKAVRGEEK